MRVRTGVAAALLLAISTSAPLAFRPGVIAKALDDFETTIEAFWDDTDSSRESERHASGPSVSWIGDRDPTLGYGRGMLKITSGYRCPQKNADLRPTAGAPNSRHQYGDAVDLIPLEQAWNRSERDLLAYAASYVYGGAATYIEDWGDSPGQTKDHVHADWR